MIQIIIKKVLTKGIQLYKLTILFAYTSFELTTALTPESKQGYWSPLHTKFSGSPQWVPGGPNFHGDQGLQYPSWEVIFLVCCQGLPISGDIPIYSIYLFHFQHCVEDVPPNLLRRLDKCGVLRERDVASWWPAALSKITIVGSRCLF